MNVIDLWASLVSDLPYEDGDDQSQEWLGDDAIQQFEDFLQTQTSEDGEPARLSALVGPFPDGCTSATGTALSGAQYLDLALSSGGYSASICALDLTPLMDWIGETSQTEQPRFKLQATPRADSIRVQVNDSRWDEGWSLIDDSIIEFTAKPPPGAEIYVRYEVLAS